MGKKVTEKIRFWGIVQGVGFRPYVAKMAAKYDMKGTVANIGGLVQVVVTDTEKHIDHFVQALQESKPEGSEIVHIRRDRLGEEGSLAGDYRVFQDFTIEESGQGEDEVAMIPADIAICPQCLKEMRDPANRRYKHPFISCMSCGPRYTIVDRFPYDRHNTSMVDFPMCPECNKEYTSLADRRYHAQTISCHDCGPQMKGTQRLEDDTERTVIEKAAGLLLEGSVIAFKGVGGYNLIANPADADAVKALRKAKGREKKPFAVMFRDVEQVKKYCYVSDVAKRLLESSARPILLLDRRTEDEMQAVRPGNYGEFLKSRTIGCFLPSFGAQYLLLEKFGGPLIVTSANVSDMPIIKDDIEMSLFADDRDEIAAVFYNLRKIRVRVDDSVVRVIDGQPQMIRRSKGYAPVRLYSAPWQEEVGATGGQLKNSFALSKGGFVYMSQYFGDLVGAETRKIYEDNIERMGQLFRITPKKVVCDLHPDYYSTVFAEKYAKEKGLPLVRVQHHHAHVASVMAEHNIQGPIIGVSFDGTGYGTDGAVWGGEFLLCEGGSFQRLAHLKYVDMLGGDSSAKNCWQSALSYLHARDAGAFLHYEEDDVGVNLQEITDYCKEMGTLEHREMELTESILNAGINTVRSSSMGRLFDAVSAFLGICDYNSYEGQAAMMLEEAATRALKGEPEATEVDELALKFHHQVIHMIVSRCEKIRQDTGVSQVALTGGVFQNRLIVEECLRQLRANGFKTYCNISVSPNDGGIALGQAYIASFVDAE